MQHEEILAALQAVEAFRQIDPSQLQWLISRGELTELAAGDYLFRKGDPVEKMHIIIRGSIQLKILQGKQLKDLQLLEKGDITGLLPYSRMREATGIGIATEPSVIFSLHKKHFQEMEKHSREMVQALVAVMTTRARDFTRRQQQDDKMMALGKLSAGLAHELNNPASAIIRSAAALKKQLWSTPENFKQMALVQLSPEQVDALNDLLFERISQPQEQSLSVLQRSQQEDEIADWLEELGMEDGYDLAETLVEFGFDISDLEEISEITKEQFVIPVIGWLHNMLSTERLVSEIEQASTRISDLVQSVKTYSHMDRGQDKEKVDIRQGMDSTLTMLSHKLKEKHIQVHKNYDAQAVTVKGFVGKLNQVWTNLIDNAIDAMQQGGTLRISTQPKNDKVLVSIQDDGSGIPPELQHHIFDPFFSTKEVGKGTGLGLDIVKKILDQHQAEISVESKPGETLFRILFPTY